MKDATMVNEEISVPGKCTKQYVQTVEKNAKFPSNPQKEDQSTVLTASQNTENQDSKLNLKLKPNNSIFQ